MKFVSFAICLLIICSYGSTQETTDDKKKLPVIDTTKAKTQYTVMAGQNAVLTCPIADANGREVFYFWYKGAEPVTSLWTRFWDYGNVLKIKSAIASDAANYTCRATNGFGIREFTVSLSVLDEPDDEVDVTDPGKDEEARILLDEPATNKQELSVGSSFRMKCRASGRPLPQIKWFKDDVEINVESRGRRKRGSLLIRSVTPQDAGNYRCKATNSLGSDYRDVLLTVKPSSVASDTGGAVKSNMVEVPHPVNMTVNYGQPTSFLCKVRSEERPVIYWLRKVDRPPLPGEPTLSPDSTFHYKDDTFVVLDKDDATQEDQDLYVNKLHIKAATEKDTGLYACAGSNRLGFNYQFIYLRVLPADAASGDNVVTATAPPKSRAVLSLPLIIALPTGLALVLAGIMIYLLMKRRKLALAAAHRLRIGRGQAHMTNGYNNGYAVGGASAPLIGTVVHLPNAGANGGSAYAQKPVLTNVPLAGRGHASSPPAAGFAPMIPVNALRSAALSPDASPFDPANKLYAAPLSDCLAAQYTPSHNSHQSQFSHFYSQR